MAAIERSNHKNADSKNPRQTVRLKVYDVIDEEPNPELDIDEPEITAEEELDNVDIIDEDTERDIDDNN